MAPKGTCPNPGTWEYYLMWQKGLCRCKLKKKKITHRHKNMYMLTESLCCTGEINSIANQLYFSKIKQITNFFFKK